MSARVYVTTLLMVTGFTFLSRLTQIAPPYTRFVFLGAGFRLGLPSHPASRRRSCLRLGVSTTSSSRKLSPPKRSPMPGVPKSAALCAAARRRPAGSAFGRFARRGPRRPVRSAPTDQASSPACASRTDHGRGLTGPPRRTEARSSWWPTCQFVRCGGPPPGAPPPPPVAPPPPTLGGGPQPSTQDAYPRPQAAKAINPPRPAVAVSTAIRQATDAPKHKAWHVP